MIKTYGFEFEIYTLGNPSKQTTIYDMECSSYFASLGRFRKRTKLQATIRLKYIEKLKF